MLQGLADHLKEFTDSTAVYIGKLLSPKRPVGDGDFEDAHIDEAAEKIINFLHATDDH